MKYPVKLHAIVIIMSVFVACVPARKFEEMQDKYNNCETDKKSCSEELRLKQISDSICRNETKLYEMRLERAKLDSIEIHTVHNKTKELYNALSDTYERLLKHNQSENDKYNGDLRDMETKKNATQKELDQKEASLNKTKDELNALQIDLKNREQKMQQMGDELKNREAKVNELQRIIGAKDSAVNALKNNLVNALLGYKEAGLEVNIKEGKVYVSLSEQLLFASGSTIVDKKGKEALLKLASILNQQPDIRILVEGHTDDVPISTDKIKDNWDLSVLRANSIVRILSIEGHVDPKRIISSGRSEYLPIDGSKSPEARKKNRRTEIILSPNLDQLMKLLEGN